jgi:translation initiation factor IF-1
MFPVDIPERRRVSALISGKMRLHLIRILPEDKVMLEISPTICREGELFIAKNDNPAGGRGFRFREL